MDRYIDRCMDAWLIESSTNPILLQPSSSPTPILFQIRVMMGRGSPSYPIHMHVEKISRAPHNTLMTKVTVAVRPRSTTSDRDHFSKCVSKCSRYERNAGSRYLTPESMPITKTKCASWKINGGGGVGGEVAGVGEATGEKEKRRKRMP